MRTMWGKYKHLVVRVGLYWRESESDIASRWVQRKSNLMFALSSDENQRKKSLSRSLSFNVDLEWLNKYADEAIYLTQYTFDVPQDLRRNWMVDNRMVNYWGFIYSRTKAKATSLRMGSQRSQSSVHMEKRQRSKKEIAYVFAFVQCKWTLRG